MEKLINHVIAKLAKENNIHFEAENFWANYYQGYPISKWKLISKEQTKDPNILPGMDSFCHFPTILLSDFVKLLETNLNISVTAKKVNEEKNIIGYNYYIASDKYNNNSVPTSPWSKCKFMTEDGALEAGVIEALFYIQKKNKENENII